MTYQTGSIAQIHRQLCEDGYCVSINTLRSWIKQGILPAAYSGRKAYVAYANVVSILTNGTPTPGTKDNATGIRRLSC